MKNAKSNGRCPIMATLSAAQMARNAEKNGDTARRNELAQAMFKAKSHRLIQRADRIVETYFQSQGKNWVTMVYDSNRNQIGDANYSGNKDDAAVGHLWALYTILDRCEDRWPFNPLA